jgi:predicted phosphodiesterase
MRYLILSDIHSNLTALETALDAAKGRWEEALCLGDVVGYGPDPNEVIDRLRDLGVFAIRGNHDKAVAGLADAEEFNPVARAAALWTRERLSPENLEYLEKLPTGPVSRDGFSMIHGAFHDEDEYVFSPALAADSLLSTPTDISFFGHTHIQGGFALRGDDIHVLHLTPAGSNSFSTFQPESGTKYLLNPGSIGQPRDGDPRAGFAIADIESRSVEFWRVGYDIETVQQRMRTAKLPEPLVLRLSFGR